MQIHGLNASDLENFIGEIKAMDIWYNWTFCRDFKENHRKGRNPRGRLLG